jgi:hypothetical protein
MASENILSTTYFMSDGCQKLLIKFQRGARTGPFKFYEWYESGLKIFESKIDFHLTVLKKK